MSGIVNARYRLQRKEAYHMPMEHDREWIIGCIKHDGFIKTDRFDKANQFILDALQTEVVRCKDCKNWRESHSEDEESYCYIDGRTTDSTDYCSWGERRE